MTDFALERAMIQEELEARGLTEAPVSWTEDEDGLLAEIGRCEIVLDDEDNGVFAGEEGRLCAQVVGSPQYGNHQVAWYVLVDDTEAAIQIDFDSMEML